MSAGVKPGALQRARHAAEGAVAILGRRGDVVGVAGQAVADDLGIDLGAARLGVLQLFENDDAGALAHDEAVAVAVIGARGLFRACRCGRSTAPGRRRSRRATSGVTGDSAPPATITSASPKMISRAASPIACAPVEQAVTTAWFGPFSPWRIDTWPETRLMSWPGMKNGLMRRGPRSFRMMRVLGDAFDAADAGADHHAGGACARPRSSGSQPESASASSAAAIP